MSTSDRINSIKEYWESPDTVSLKDENLRLLESQAILRYMPAGKAVLDVGCGNGINTIEYAKLSQRVLGVDYSSQMIARAQKRLKHSGLDNLEFRQLPLHELDTLGSDFDVVVTQRCLINLTSFEDQTAALRAIHRRLEPGGYYLMLECVAEGLDRLNELRSRFSLAPIPPAWHNCQFQSLNLIDEVKNIFTLEDQEDFSLYYLVTRILNPLLGRDYTDSVSKEVDAAARKLEEGLNEKLVQGIGAQRLLVFRKI